MSQEIFKKYSIDSWRVVNIMESGSEDLLLPKTRLAAVACLRMCKRGASFAQRFAGNGSGVDATAAGLRRALDNGDTFAEIRGLGARLFTGGSTAEHNEVERIVGCQRNLRDGFPKKYSIQSLEEYQRLCANKLCGV